MRHNQSSYTLLVPRNRRVFPSVVRRAALLASAVLGLASPAFANDATVGGAPVPVGPGFNLSPIAIWVPLPTAETVVNVDTEDLNAGAFNGVWVTATTAQTDVNIASGRSVTSAAWGVAVSSTTGNINIVNNGTVTGGLVGIYGYGAFAGDGGNVSISGTGTVNSAAEAIRGEVDTGDVNINGFSAINGRTYGVRVLTFGTGTWVGNPGGNFNIGTTTRLGAVTSGGAGIATAMLNAFGEGNTIIRASTVNAGNVGIWSTASTGNIDIGTSGAITAGTEGILAGTTSGNVTVNAGGLITAGTYGVRVGSALMTGTIASNTVGIESTGVGIATQSHGNQSVTDTGTINSTNTGIWTIGAAGNTSVRANTITSTANYGIFSTATTGNIDIATSGRVTAGTEGILASTTSGNVTSNARGLITANLYGVRIGSAAMTGTITSNTVGVESAGVGIATQTFGNQTVTDTGTINSVNTGIWTIGAGGSTNVNANAITSAANYGVFTTSTSGNNAINTTGAIRGATNGILVVSTAGNNTVTGNGTSAVTGGVEGIYINPTTSGNATITNFASITGARAGIWTVVGSGLTSIQNNAAITGNGNWGILSGAITGDINIGNMATNGPITGAIIGLDARTAGAGNINLTTNRNVTGNGTWGAYLSTVNGNIITNINGATVSGVTRGYETQVFGSGNATTNIAAAAIVQATGPMGSAYGLLTGVTSGLSTVNNAGLIRNANDTGAASLAGGDAIWHYFGAGIVNNTGRIVGRVHSNGSTSFTLNNAASGVWTPGIGIINNFGGASDTVNNTGLINIRTGTTLFTGLERLNNNAGGVIDLTYGGTQATNAVWTTGNFAPGVGSTIRVAFSPTLANNAGGIGTDSSSNARGASDTILAATVSPAARSTINLTTVGSVDSLIGTSGSVAVVQGAVALANPGMGASGSFVASSRYTLVGDPTTGAVKFNLTEASDGGAFLQWAPNITSATMGALAGGDLSGPNAAKGSAFGAARSGVSGADGVSSSLADQGASAAAGQCGASGRRTNLFTTIQTGGADYRGGGSGRSIGGALGIEGAIGNHGPDECGRTAIGIFGYGNTGKTRFSTGASSADGYGVGAYIRTGNGNGFYASLLGTGGAIDSKLTNNIFQSTSKTDALGLFVDGTAGLVKPLGEKSKIDLRSSVSYLSVATSAFTDSKGITVKSIDSKLWTAAASVGLLSPLGEKTDGFIRLGAKYSDLSRKTNAYDIILSGSSNELAGTAEVGLNTALSDNTQFGIAVNGDKSSSATNYGGRVSLRVAF